MSEQCKVGIADAASFEGTITYRRAESRDACRWYFLTHYVDQMKRHATGWTCLYRHPDGDIRASIAPTTDEAADAAMDEVERAETARLPVGEPS